MSNEANAFKSKAEGRPERLMTIPEHLQNGFISQFDECVEKTPDRVYFTFEGLPYSFRETARLVEAARAWLAELQTGPGDRVAVMMDSSPNLIAIIIGLAKSGVTWVPINTRQRKDGLRYILEHSDPRRVIADPAHADVLIEAGLDPAAGKLVLVDGAQFPTVERTAPAPCEPSGERLFAIMYTSGTTGPPKGVMITHEMMAYAAEAVALVSEAHAGDVMFVWEPLFHIGGAQMLVLPLIRPVSLAMVARFSASRFWDQVIEARASHIHYLGGILDILLSLPANPRDLAHGVRIAWGGGCPESTWLPFEERFGVRIRECYGMSEASSITTANTNHVVGSVGSALPWFDVQICDAEGAPLPPGSPGEIVVTAKVAGPVFAGYYRSEEATARALRDGRLHTGDQGRLDANGNLYFLGRNGDSVRHRGENVSAWEVESVANKHELVAGSAMVGIPGALGEQDILLYVQPVDGSPFEVAAFARWLSREVAPYQMPRYIQLVSEFDRTPSERIMKHKLTWDPAQCWDRLAPMAAVGG